MAHASIGTQIRILPGEGGGGAGGPPPRASYGGKKEKIMVRVAGDAAVMVSMARRAAFHCLGDAVDVCARRILTFVLILVLNKHLLPCRNHNLS